MNEVRVGSEVVCADASDTEGLLKPGRIYVVSRVSGELIGLEGVEDGLMWTTGRFVAVVRDAVEVEPSVAPASVIEPLAGYAGDAPVFEVGDRIRCVREPKYVTETGSVELGAEYVVEALVPDTYGVEGIGSFLVLAGVPHRWVANRFELVAPASIDQFPSASAFVESDAPLSLETFDAAVAEMRSHLVDVLATA